MNCPLCKKKVLGEPLMEHGRYKLYQCASCTNGFWHPLEMPLGKWYANAENEDNEALSYTYMMLHSTSSILSIAHIYFLKAMPLKEGKLLDIGCGNGSFMVEASKRFSVYGIDFDPKCIEAAKKRGLKNVFSISLSGFREQNPGKRFDILTFFEVLEHQSDPDSFFKDVKKLLKKEGYIAGSVPLHKEMKPFGKGDVPPNHFLMFTKGGLERYLKLKGFKSVMVKEVVDKSRFRSALGINSYSLRSFFGFSRIDTSTQSFKYRLYLFARNLGRLMLPIIDFFVSVYRALIGEKEARKIEQSSSGVLYFQARL